MNIRRNIEKIKYIIIRTDNFIIIGPTTKYLIDIFNKKQNEYNKSKLFQYSFLSYDNSYNKRKQNWKNINYLQIQGFELFISSKIINIYIINNHIL